MIKEKEIDYTNILEVYEEGVRYGVELTYDSIMKHLPLMLQDMKEKSMLAIAKSNGENN